MIRSTGKGKATQRGIPPTPSREMIKKAWVRKVLLPFSKFLNVSESQFPHLGNVAITFRGIRETR